MNRTLDLLLAQFREDSVKKALALTSMILTLMVTTGAHAQRLGPPFGNHPTFPQVCRDELPFPLLGGVPPAVSVTIKNATGSAGTVYVGFLAGTTSCYQPADFSAFCTADPANAEICTIGLGAGATQVLHFGPKNTANCKASFAVAFNQEPWQGCNNTFAELTLDDAWTNPDGSLFGYYDSYDLSVVNGFSVKMTLTPSGGSAVSVSSASGNQKITGVYPFGCDDCDHTANPPSCGTVDPKQCKSATDVANGRYVCHVSATSGTYTSYTLNIGG